MLTTSDNFLIACCLNGSMKVIDLATNKVAFNVADSKKQKINCIERLPDFRIAIGANDKLATIF